MFMHVFEGLSGTSRSSYLKLENARMIIRHNNKVDETKFGARSRCVESIFVENDAGERMLFPTTNLAPARALTQHISMGGTFTDVVTQQINRIAQEFVELGQCVSYCAHNMPMLPESAGAIHEKCRDKMRSMKKTFERMYRSKSGYVAEAKRMEDAARTLTENEEDDTVDPTMLDEVRETLTLEGKDALPDAVLESVCKCVHEQSEPFKKHIPARPASYSDDYDHEEEAMGKPEVKRDFHGRPIPVFGKKGVKEGAKDEGYRYSKSAPQRYPDEDDEAKPDVKRDFHGRPIPVFGKKGVKPEVAEAVDLVSGISVLGREVKEDAWNKLKQGKIELLGKPSLTDTDGNEANPSFGDKTGEMLFKLGAILPIIKDDSLMNLLSFVHERLPEERDPAIVKKMRMLILYVLKAAGMSMNEGIASRNTVIRGFEDWVSGFRANVVLAESMIGADLTGGDVDHDPSVDEADANFSVHDFMSSDCATEGLLHDVTDKQLEAADVRDALTNYLEQSVEKLGGDSMADVSWVADKRLPEIIAQLSQDGYVVSGDQDVAESEFESDLDMMDDEGDLTREDILLPADNEGESLAREVMPHRVRDPQSGAEESPDSAYIERLRSLSGMNPQRRTF